MILGILIPMTVGIGETMTILNWRKYSAGFDENERPWYSYIISNFIVLFPALDVISVFPLESIYISDNILAFVYGKNDNRQVTKKWYFLYRLAGVVPPFLIALFVYDLGQILDYAGMISLVIIGIYIPLM